MSSSSTLPNKYFNRLQVNRLQAQNSKITTLDSSDPKYLFSLLLNKATLTKTSGGGTLTFTKDKVESVIEFTERPLKLTKTISIDSFIDLFSPGIAGDNTFSEDPPNSVLVFKEEQKTYQLKTATSDGNGNYTIELNLIDGETHDNLNPVTDIMSLFVDSVNITTTTTTYPYTVSGWYNTQYKNYGVKFIGNGYWFQYNGIVLYKYNQSYDRPTIDESNIPSSFDGTANLPYDNAEQLMPWILNPPNGNINIKITYNNKYMILNIGKYTPDIYQLQTYRMPFTLFYVTAGQNNNNTYYVKLQIGGKYTPYIQYENVPFNNSDPNWFNYATITNRPNYNYPTYFRGWCTVPVGNMNPTQNSSTQYKQDLYNYFFPTSEHLWISVYPINESTESFKLWIPKNYSSFSNGGWVYTNF